MMWMSWTPQCALLDQVIVKTVNDSPCSSLQKRRSAAAAQQGSKRSDSSSDEAGEMMVLPDDVDELDPAVRPA